MSHRRAFLWLPRRMWSRRLNRKVWRWLRFVWIAETTTGNKTCPECRTLGEMCPECVQYWAIK